MRFSWKKVLITVGLMAAVVWLLVLGQKLSRRYGFSNDSAKAVATAAPVVQKSAPKTTDVIAPVVQTNVGVELRGCGGDDAWLKNTNPCSILVRHVQRSSNMANHFGERTDWMTEIKSGGFLRVGVGRTSQTPHETSYSLYIYNTNGGLIGFISGDCPPPVQKQ